MVDVTTNQTPFLPSASGSNPSAEVTNSSRVGQASTPSTPEAVVTQPGTVQDNGTISTTLGTTAPGVTANDVVLATTQGLVTPTGITLHGNTSQVNDSTSSDQPLALTVGVTTVNPIGNVTVAQQLPAASVNSTDASTNETIVQSTEDPRSISNSTVPVIGLSTVVVENQTSTTAAIGQLNNGTTLSDVQATSAPSVNSTEVTDASGSTNATPSNSTSIGEYQLLIIILCRG